MTTSSCWVRGYNSTPSPTVQSTPVNRTVERDSGSHTSGLRTTMVKFFKKYLSEGMSDPDKIIRPGR